MSRPALTRRSSASSPGKAKPSSRSISAMRAGEAGGCRRTSSSSPSTSTSRRPAVPSRTSRVLTAASVVQARQAVDLVARRADQRPDAARRIDADQLERLDVGAEQEAGARVELQALDVREAERVRRRRPEPGHGIDPDELVRAPVDSVEDARACVVGETRAVLDRLAAGPVQVGEDGALAGRAVDAD